MAGVAGAQHGLGRLVAFNAPNGFNGEYDDLLGPMAQAGGVSALKYERYRNAPNFEYFFQHNVNESVYQKYQVKHRWKRGTSLGLHIHCIPCAAVWAEPPVTRNVILEVAYHWSVTGTEVPDLAGWTITPVTIPITNALRYQDRIFGLVTIAAPAQAKESSLLRVRLTRLSTDPGDTYDVNKDHGTPAANFAVSDIDCHFQQEKAGTFVEYPV